MKEQKSQEEIALAYFGIPLPNTPVAEKEVEVRLTATELTSLCYMVAQTINAYPRDTHPGWLDFLYRKLCESSALKYNTTKLSLHETGALCHILMGKIQEVGLKSTPQIICDLYEKLAAANSRLMYEDSK